MTQSKKAPVKQSKWETFFLVTALVCACFVLCAAGIWAGRPHMHAKTLELRNQEIERTLIAERRRLDKLERKAAAIDSDQGKETEARNIGFARKGDVPLILSR